MLLSQVRCVLWGLPLAGGMGFISGCQATRGGPSSPPAVAAPPIAPAEKPGPAGQTAEEPLTFPDTVTLTNGSIRLGIAPSVGRVVDFGLVGGRNLIWLATEAVYDKPISGANDQQYFNLGGDKLWPTTQSRWFDATGNKAWPPDGTLDGSPWQLLEHDERSLTMQSPVSDAYGLQITRRFELSPDEPQAIITNTFERISANPIPVSIWSVTQVVTPDVVLMDLAADVPAELEPFTALTPNTLERTQGMTEVTAPDGVLIWRQAGPLHSKYGSFGRWIAGVYDDVTFFQRTAYDPAGEYPDTSNVQTYRGDPYLELELWSPQAALAPGEKLSNQVTWQLLPVGGDAAVKQLQTLDPLTSP